MPSLAQVLYLCRHEWRQDNHQGSEGKQPQGGLARDSQASDHGFHGRIGLWQELAGARHHRSQVTTGAERHLPVVCAAVPAQIWPSPRRCHRESAHRHRH